MDAMRHYIMALTAAAILCALVKAISPGKKGQEKILGLVCGIFLLATALRPLGLLQLPEAWNPTAEFEQEAQQVVSAAQEKAQTEMAGIITEQTRAYIQDKAEALGVRLEISVVLDESLLPTAVTLTGPVSPYAKSRLSGAIQESLGIPEERQVWRQ